MSADKGHVQINGGLPFCAHLRLLTRAGLVDHLAVKLINIYMRHSELDLSKMSTLLEETTQPRVGVQHEQFIPSDVTVRPMHALHLSRLRGQR